MIDWKIETPKIETEASLWAVDPRFVETIRHCENGDAGREFGVLSETAPTYGDQLRICCETVAHRLSSYGINPLCRTPNGRLRYSNSWIAYFAHIWAPSKAKNDPTNLNANWYENAVKFYEHLLPA